MNLPPLVPYAAASLIALRGKMEGHERGLLLDFGRVDYPECWWKKR